MNEPLVACIFTNYNGYNTKYKNISILYHTFSSFKKTEYSNYKVIVVDDNSKDDSVNYIKKNWNFIDVISNKKNLGFSRSNNKGILYAIENYNPEYFILLNNDLIFENKYWLKNLIDVAEKDKKIGIESCKFIGINNLIQHTGSFEFLSNKNRGRGEKNNKNKYNKIEEVKWVAAAVMLIKKSLIDKIGLLEENFKFMEYEDLDFCLRAKNADFKVMYNGEVTIKHLEGFSSTNSPFDQAKLNRAVYGQKNFVYFIKKNWRYLNFYEKTYGIFIFYLIGNVFTIENNKGNRGIRYIRFKKGAVRRLISAIKTLIVN